MGAFSGSASVYFFSLVTLLLFEFSHPAATLVLDGVWQWRKPRVHIGDSVVFQDKPPYSLYIFKNLRAFTICNFSQASSLTKPGSSSYTWHVSRPGFFFFSMSNGSNSCCLHGHKLAVEVLNMSSISPAPSSSSPRPHAVSGSNSPGFQWPFRPKENNSGVAGYGEGGVPVPVPVPFITSNPAVPLPTGDVDSTTAISHLPNSGVLQLVAGASLLQITLMSATLLLIFMY